MMKTSWRFRFWLAFFAFTAFLLFLTIGLCDRWIQRQAASWHYDSADEVPEADVALVLGCSEFLGNGKPNLYFKYRIQAAAAAYHEGKCRYLIVSGDHSRIAYNEPQQMRTALMREGVPSDRIVCDYAGLRTLDSVVRADKVFGQRALLVVSQQFHNERAIYIARQYGIEMIGLNAQDVTGSRSLRTRFREKLARVKTMIDVHLIGTQPRHLGEPIQIGSSANA